MARRLIRNAARCNTCGQELESLSVHDFRTCGCGNLSVDGGPFYARRLYHTGEGFTELSTYEGSDDDE